MREMAECLQEMELKNKEVRTPSKFAEIFVEMHLTAEKISTYHQSGEWDHRSGWQLAKHLWQEHE